MTALGVILTKNKLIVFLIQLNKTGKEILIPATCSVTSNILLKEVKSKYFGFWFLFKVKISRCPGISEFDLVSSCVLGKNNHFKLGSQLSNAVTNYL